jgi:5'(3')-deoxyribonucleotidase
MNPWECPGMLAGQKATVMGAWLLIDDNVRHFQRFTGQGILFTSPHNINETGYVRVNNWLEVKDYFLK